MTRLRIGFLGTGWIGRHRMAAMADTGLIDVVAVADPSEAMQHEAQAIAPAAAIVPDLDALLSLDLDGVVIATPSALHAAQTIQALEAGVAVFCQKPLGRDAAEVTAAVDAARRADRLLHVDLSYRQTAAMQAIAARIRDGGLGTPQLIDLVFHNAYGPDKPWFYDPAASGGGCVMDLGVHLIDLALWALDWPAVEDVRAHLFSGGAPLGTRTDVVEDLATATLTLAGGTVVTLACSWRLHAGEEAAIAARFYGSDGGTSLSNVDGSFYDFEGHWHRGTTRETLSLPPDAWGGRAAVAWAERLAQDRSFDPAADRYIDSARVLDRIYAR